MRRRALLLAFPLVLVACEPTRLSCADAGYTIGFCDAAALVMDVEHLDACSGPKVAKIYEQCGGSMREQVKEATSK